MRGKPGEQPTRGGYAMARFLTCLLFLFFFRVGHAEQCYSGQMTNSRGEVVTLGFKVSSESPLARWQLLDGSPILGIKFSRLGGGGLLFEFPTSVANRNETDGVVEYKFEGRLLDRTTNQSFFLNGTLIAAPAQTPAPSTWTFIRRRGGGAFRTEYIDLEGTAINCLDRP